MTSREQIDAKLAFEETQPMTDEEKKVCDEMLGQLAPEDAEKLSELDKVTVIRGYQTYEPRQEETNKALNKIVEWRNEVGYYRFLKERLEGDEGFHRNWEERIYGEDKYGHPLIAIHVGRVDTDALFQMDEAQMLRLQGQKLAAYTHYKQQVSERIGTQRYKYSVVVDMKGLGMSVLGGRKRGILQKVFSVGSDYFPESVWKIYVVNTPMVFRAVWAVVKLWIHPITLAKVNILGSSSSTIMKQMAEDGYAPEALPEFIGGKRPEAEARTIFDYLREVIDSNQQPSE